MMVKSPEVIYLIDTGDGIVWCDDPDPTGYGECDDAVKYVRWDTYEALQAECELLRKDAERYRWLRSGGDDDIGVSRGFDGIDCGSTSVAYTYEEVLCGERLDAAIDAARAGGE